jgi:hypothetical protein
VGAIWRLSPNPIDVLAGAVTLLAGTVCVGSPVPRGNDGMSALASEFPLTIPEMAFEAGFAAGTKETDEALGV